MAKKQLYVDLKEQGNDAFKNKKYKKAARKFTLALKAIKLERLKDGKKNSGKSEESNTKDQYTELEAILYSNRSAAQISLGDFAKAIKDADRAIEVQPTYVKAYMRKAFSQKESNQLEESLSTYRFVLSIDETNSKAQSRINELLSEMNDDSDDDENDDDDDDSSDSDRDNKKRKAVSINAYYDNPDRLLNKNLNYNSNTPDINPNYGVDTEDHPRKKQKSQVKQETVKRNKARHRRHKRHGTTPWAPKCKGGPDYRPFLY